MTYQTDPNRTSTGSDPEIVAALPYIPAGGGGDRVGADPRDRQHPRDLRDRDRRVARDQPRPRGRPGRRRPRWPTPRPRRSRSSSGAGTWPSDPSGRRIPAAHRGGGPTATASLRHDPVVDVTVQAGPQRERHPLHKRRDVLLLVAPDRDLPGRCSRSSRSLYSLGISFFDWSQTTSSFTFIGLDNYRRPAARIRCSGRRSVNTAILVGRRASPSRWSWAPRSRCSSTCTCVARGSFAASSSCRCCSRPIVVGLMWRALLNPDWGIVN